MQVYFIKATYTNNVYKIGDFFTADQYKLDPNKMLNINWKPDDGISEFITKNITLPDESLIWEHTHIIVPDYDKIFRISSVDYLNVQQYRVIVDEDPLIGNYQDLRSKTLIMKRTNRPEFFRGVNDIANLSIKESVTTEIINNSYHTGKWALLFFQFDSTDTTVGLRFSPDFEGDIIIRDTLANIITAYPETTTSDPELVEYFGKYAYATDKSRLFECGYYNGALKWAENVDINTETVYFKTIAGVAETNAKTAKINDTDVMTICLALPFSTQFNSNDTDNYRLLSYDKFLGPIDTSLIDIKIIDDIFLKITGVSESVTGDSLFRTIQFASDTVRFVDLYSDAATTTLIFWKSVNVFQFYDSVDISASYITTTPDPKSAEPFNKYELYVYGKKFDIPYYLTDKIKILMAINSGVINYSIYYDSAKRNILATGSFTHSIKYQIDQLDAFYSQNPTYKEQFFTKMAIDSVKTIAGGAIAGSAIPGIGTVAGAGVGLMSAGVDAGVGLLNLHYQEKGLRLKPDQMFGENSEVSLQVVNLFGIYWVKRTPENADMMLVEYDLRGFPTSRTSTINSLDYEISTMFGTSKIIFGEVKQIVKNLYVTGYINQKLQEGIILIP